MKEDGMVLSCHKSIHHTMYYSELGASRAVLVAGYNIDSLMIRFGNYLGTSVVNQRDLVIGWPSLPW